MGRGEFISGPNFSGRSRLLLARARELGAATYFLGPYAEAARPDCHRRLPMKSKSIAQEVATVIGHCSSARGRRCARNRIASREASRFCSHYTASLSRRLARSPSTRRSNNSMRATAPKPLDYLGTGRFDVVLTDNRAQPPGWDTTQLQGRESSFACDWDGLQQAIAPQLAPRIYIRQLSFGYRPDTDISDNAEVVLEPGQAHRLSGPNGAGKTTSLKILVGALVPRSAHISLDGAAYEPWRTGNTALALATQNPDQQWCGATLREDMDRRRAALSGQPANAMLTQARI